MALQFGVTTGAVNSQYAPLAALLAHYRHHERLKPLEQVDITMRKRVFSASDKLQQVLVSLLAGCETLVEVNSRLRLEPMVAAAGGWSHFADQATLSRTLDRLTLMNIGQLRSAVDEISAAHSAVRQHDWRGHLWLDFDLSGLPCGPRAQGSQKGYFSGKKTSPAAN